MLYSVWFRRVSARHARQLMGDRVLASGWLAVQTHEAFTACLSREQLLKGYLF